MSLSKDDLNRLAEGLVGSDKLLSDVAESLTKDDLRELDNLVFLCQVCCWWYEDDERTDAFDVCDDCSCHA